MDLVNLTVKAANQQFEDKNIVCQPSWSVKQLKEHLSQIYSCKPSTDEQKLIYSGQLLADKVILKDILRSYEDTVEPPSHTFHLVYTPKTRQMPTNATKTSAQSSTSDGLRQRNNIQTNSTAEVTNNRSHTAATAQSLTSSTVPNLLTQMTNNAAGNCPTSNPAGSNFPPYGFNQPPNEYVVAQQMAMQSWMQQAYIQYMNQYMSLLSIGVRPETVFMQNQMPTAAPSGGGVVPQMPFLSQNLPIPQANLGQNLSNVPTGAPESANPPRPNVQAATANNTPVPPVEQPAQPQNPPQPRFPNIVQEELPENRDWLDIFYAFSRLLLLLTLVYFYSSPLRCLVVLFIGLAIYLYHIGFFRTQQQQPQQQQPNEANNNNNNNNNNAAAGAAGQPRGEQENQQENPGVNNQVANSENSNDTAVSDAAVVDVANNGTSMVAFVRTFVVSFFVSLLPETAEL